ncbi:hypothetical protein [Streptomyces fulvoviolaceus]|uniref:hypothetical protein n=1 Tax=Streptomyces fulvoviolaceus TaxID=285535 RepID=UPI0004C9AA63
MAQGTASPEADHHTIELIHSPPCLPAGSSHPLGYNASYAFFQARPLAVQAWHGEHELRGRHLMRDGVWAV